MMKPKKEKEEGKLQKEDTQEEEMEEEEEEETKEEAAVLPMEPSTSISTIQLPQNNQNINVTAVSTLALPSLTLSVTPSSFKQCHTPHAPTTPAGAVPKSAIVKKQVPGAHTQAPPPSQPPIFPKFTKTLEPKYIVGGPSGIFSKEKEKDWRRTLFGGSAKGTRKEGPSDMPAVTSSTSSSTSTVKDSVDRGTG
ncbi:hypothetical protein E2C01_087368 [Portunus trituberculatus]|uniref:Uncharacterized protein n=1 Tax=Portunus trituberculatus TaxID=210409 RepID=A0A5B7JBP4_PORTR|nr:hypothetical protein [Portunus trituberculatus]